MRAIVLQSPFPDLLKLRFEYLEMEMGRKRQLSFALLLITLAVAAASRFHLSRGNRRLVGDGNVHPAARGVAH